MPPTHIMDISTVLYCILISREPNDRVTVVSVGLRVIDGGQECG